MVSAVPGSEDVVSAAAVLAAIACAANFVAAFSGGAAAAVPGVTDNADNANTAPRRTRLNWRNGRLKWKSGHLWPRGPSKLNRGISPPVAQPFTKRTFQ